MNLRKLVLASAIAAAIGAPATVVADSETSYGGVGTQAQASVDFQIVIEDFVYFQVGTAGNGTVDQVDFSLIGLESGDSNAVPQTGPALNVVLRSNTDNVSVAASGGNLTGGVLLGNIPFTQITASNAGGATPIAVPDFGATLNLPAGPYDLADTWSYSYDNTAVYARDTYTGTVTYTVETL